jgi:molybdopterin/thiamine biosynthesis adenylyltransferase
MGTYDRQKTLGLKIPDSISVIGCGGIGFHVAKFAAMSGIAKIFLFDPDLVEDHNLNRIDLPENAVGKNKAAATREMINLIRPECTVYSLPFILQEHTYSKTTWMVDCTDNLKSQMTNQDIAKKFGSRYLKAGYNGESITIANAVAEWGDAPDGYTIVPSWVVPATIVAALTIAKIMKYENYEIATEIKRLFTYKK